VQANNLISMKLSRRNKISFKKLNNKSINNPSKFYLSKVIQRKMLKNMKLKSLNPKVSLITLKFKLINKFRPTKRLIKTKGISLTYRPVRFLPKDITCNSAIYKSPFKELQPKVNSETSLKSWTLTKTSTIRWIQRKETFCKELQTRGRRNSSKNWSTLVKKEWFMTQISTELRWQSKIGINWPISWKDGRISILKSKKTCNNTSMSLDRL